MTTAKKLDLDRIEVLASHLVGPMRPANDWDAGDVRHALRAAENFDDDIVGVPDKRAAEYIAYMRPEVTLALVAEIKRLRAELGRLKVANLVRIIDDNG